MKLIITALTAFVLLGVLARPATAQQGATISVSPGTFAYPYGDPDTTPNCIGPQLTISYKVTGKPIGWTITVQGTDLNGPMPPIPVSNVSWTATGNFFMPNGTLRATAQTLAQQLNGHAATTQYGYVTFSLLNSWTYNAGTYTQTITFTITIP